MARVSDDSLALWSADSAGRTQSGLALAWSLGCVWGADGLACGMPDLGVEETERGKQQLFAVYMIVFST